MILCLFRLLICGVNDGATGGGYWRALARLRPARASAHARASQPYTLIFIKYIVKTPQIDMANENHDVLA